MAVTHAQLHQNNVFDIGAYPNHSEYEAGRTGWHKITPQSVGATEWTIRHKRTKQLIAAWQTDWTSMAGGPVDVAPADGGSAREVGGAVDYTSGSGQARTDVYVWLDASWEIAWSSAVAVAVSYLGAHAQLPVVAEYRIA